jgi:parallel beta-helix repeat protein
MASRTNAGAVATGLVGCLMLTPGTARAATEVGCGDVIDQPGQYVLSGDQTCTGNGLRIQDTRDVALRFNGFHLTGPGGAVALVVTNATDVRISGGTIAGQFGRGIQVGDSSRVTIARMEVTDILITEGIIFVRVTEGRILDSVVRDGLNGHGIVLEDSTGVLIRGTDVSGHCGTFGGGGIVLRSSTDNADHRIIGNRVGPNCGTGILVGVGATENRIRDNDASGNALGIQVEGTDNAIQGNTTTDNAMGIFASLVSASNVFKHNRSRDNGTDLRDDNVPCANTWNANTFVTEVDPGGCIE